MKADTTDKNLPPIPLNEISETPKDSINNTNISRLNLLKTDYMQSVGKTNAKNIDSPSNKDGTFITNLNSKARDVIEKSAKGREIVQLNGKIHSQIESMNGFVQNLLNEHEKNFMSTYKSRMGFIKKELLEYKEKADEIKLKLSHDSKLVVTTRERDWFRMESLKLSQELKEKNIQVEKLKLALRTIEEDRNFFQQELYKVKHLNKALNLDLFKFKSIHFSDESEMKNENLGQLSSKRFTSKIKIPMRQSQKLIPKHVSDENYYYKEIGSQQNLNLNENFEQKNEEIGYKMKNYEEEDKKLRSQIINLKKQLDFEKRNNKDLRTIKASINYERSELKDFFLNCIEEVKKDIQRRKIKTSGSSTRDAGQRAKTSAIKGNIEKPIEEDAKFKNFTASDKRKVIELLLSDEQVLLLLFDMLFPNQATGNPSSAAAAILKKSGFKISKQYRKEDIDLKQV